MIHWQFEMEQQEFSTHQVLNEAIIDQMVQSFEFTLVIFLFGTLNRLIPKSWLVWVFTLLDAHELLGIQKRLKLLYIKFKNTALIFAKAGNSIKL